MSKIKVLNLYAGIGGKRIMEFEELQGHYFNCKENYCSLCDKYEQLTKEDHAHHTNCPLKEEKE